MFTRSSRCVSDLHCVEVDVPAFVRSSKCESHTCVEVAVPAACRCVGESHCVEVAVGAPVLVRDSKLPAGAPMLTFHPAAWTAFTTTLGD